MLLLWSLPPLPALCPPQGDAISTWCLGILGPSALPGFHHGVLLLRVTRRRDKLASRDNLQGETLFGAAACGLVTAAAPDRWHMVAIALTRGDGNGCAGPLRPWGSTTPWESAGTSRGRKSLSPERLFKKMQLISLMLPPALLEGSSVVMAEWGSVAQGPSSGRSVLPCWWTCCWRWRFSPANEAVPPLSC